MSVKPVPEGYHAFTPYLVVDNADGVLEFLKSAFGAQEQFLMRLPDGTLAHAEYQVGDSKVMIGQANEKWPAMPGCIYHYVPDCDAVFQKAIEAGGEVVMEPQDQFYGDRHGGVKDPGGNVWWISTHIEDVSHEELKRRLDSWSDKAAAENS